MFKDDSWLCSEVSPKQCSGKHMWCPAFKPGLVGCEAAPSPLVSLLDQDWFLGRGGIIPYSDQESLLAGSCDHRDAED